MSDLVSFNLGSIAGLRTFKRVWTNPNPDAEFAGQTIDITTPWPVSIYSNTTEPLVLFVVYKINPSYDRVSVKPVVYGQYISQHLSSMRTVRAYRHQVGNQLDGYRYYLGVTFSNAYRLNSTNEIWETSNDYAIPLYIYAYEPNL